jgi:hypothetical protein
MYNTGLTGIILSDQSVGDNHEVKLTKRDTANRRQQLVYNILAPQKHTPKQTEHTRLVPKC